MIWSWKNFIAYFFTFQLELSKTPHLSIKEIIISFNSKVCVIQSNYLVINQIRQNNSRALWSISISKDVIIEELNEKILKVISQKPRLWVGLRHYYVTK